MKKAKKALGIKDDIVILTATSGDTGKAALEGFHDIEGLDRFVAVSLFRRYGSHLIVMPSLFFLPFSFLFLPVVLNLLPHCRPALLYLVVRSFFLVVRRYFTLFSGVYFLVVIMRSEAT